MKLKNSMGVMAHCFVVRHVIALNFNHEDCRRTEDNGGKHDNNDEGCLHHNLDTNHNLSVNTLRGSLTIPPVMSLLIAFPIKHD